MSLEVIWIVYALIGSLLFAAAFIWAVRSGQFRHQDRARHLPLHSPPQEPEDSDRDDTAGPDTDQGLRGSGSEI